MNKAVKLGPVGGQISKQFVNLGVVTHIAVKDQGGVKVCRKFCNAVFKAFANIAKSQLGALFVARFGDAVGDRAVRQHAGD